MFKTTNIMNFNTWPILQIANDKAICSQLPKWMMNKYMDCKAKKFYQIQYQITLYLGITFFKIIIVCQAIPISQVKSDFSMILDKIHYKHSLLFQIKNNQ